jgi:YgiT-type zinc finger domain-containing protein
MVDIANKEGNETMRKIDISKEACSECGGRLERKYITQEFERGGLRVKLTGIAALICNKCGEIYFQPGGADKVADAVNSLFSLAVIEKQHKRQLTAQVSQA